MTDRNEAPGFDGENDLDERPRRLRPAALRVIGFPDRSGGIIVTQRDVDSEIGPPGVRRNHFGLVPGYDDLVGRVWQDEASDDPERHARAERTRQELGIPRTEDDGK
jgi:hypothetical protein